MSWGLEAPVGPDQGGGARSRRSNQCAALPTRSLNGVRSSELTPLVEDDEVVRFPLWRATIDKYVG